MSVQNVIVQTVFVSLCLEYSRPLMVCDFYSCSIDFRLQSKRRFVASLAKLFKKAHDLPLVFNIYCLLLYDWLSFVLQHQEFTALTHCNGPISNNPFLGEVLFKIMKDNDLIFHTKPINKITVAGLGNRIRDKETEFEAATDCKICPFDCLNFPPCIKHPSFFMLHDKESESWAI